MYKVRFLQNGELELFSYTGNTVSAIRGKTEPVQSGHYKMANSMSDAGEGYVNIFFSDGFAALDVSEESIEHGMRVEHFKVSVEAEEMQIVEDLLEGEEEAEADHQEEIERAMEFLDMEEENGENNS